MHMLHTFLQSSTILNSQLTTHYSKIFFFFYSTVLPLLFHTVRGQFPDVAGEKRGDVNVTSCLHLFGLALLGGTPSGLKFRSFAFELSRSCTPYFSHSYFSVRTFALVRLYINTQTHTYIHQHIYIHIYRRVTGKPERDIQTETVRTGQVEQDK